jgi:LiaI-LiaF-like transmembrane region
MDAQRRGGLIGGLLLILLGGAFLAAQFVPAFQSWFRAEQSWPLLIIGIGVLFLVLAVALRTPGLAIPGCIVGGIGCLLFYQNATGDWGSWAYAWTLITGFVGLGVVFAGLLEGRSIRSVSAGLWMILISLAAFLVFGSFLGMGQYGAYWPVLLIVGGLLILGRSLFGRKG